MCHGEYVLVDRRPLLPRFRYHRLPLFRREQAADEPVSGESDNQINETGPVCASHECSEAYEPLKADETYETYEACVVLVKHATYAIDMTAPE